MGGGGSIGGATEKDASAKDHGTWDGRAIEAARPAAGEPGLCTIGYEGSSLEGDRNRLLRAGVTLPCDVRRNPLSRKYGFSKGTLSKGCAGVGVRYEHLPQQCHRHCVAKALERRTASLLPRRICDSTMPRERDCAELTLESLGGIIPP